MGEDMAARAKGTARAKRPAQATKTAQAAKTAQETKTAQARETGQAGGAGPAREPKALLLAAAAQGIEAVGLAVAAVFAAVSTADGQSHTAASGIALTVLGFAVAGGLAAIAVGLAQARPWSRVPAVLTQLCVIIAGIALLDGHRPEWGVPALVLAGACLAGLFTPASLRALNRQLDPPPVNDR
jgi:hypothetical protein